MRRLSYKLEKLPGHQTACPCSSHGGCSPIVIPTRPLRQALRSRQASGLCLVESSSRGNGGHVVFFFVSTTHTAVVRPKRSGLVKASGLLTVNSPSSGEQTGLDFPR